LILRARGVTPGFAPSFGAVRVVPSSAPMGSKRPTPRLMLGGSNSMPNSLASFMSTLSLSVSSDSIVMFAAKNSAVKWTFSQPV